MALKQLEDAKLLKKAKQREALLDQMQTLLADKRALSDEETKTFDRLERDIEALDKELNGTTLEDLTERIEERNKRFEALKDPKEQQQQKKVETRATLPTEVRSYKKGERMGNGSDNITLGDILVAHTTGRMRTPEIRELLTTNSGGVTISSEVFNGFIDYARAESFIDEFTLYKMDSKTLTIPQLRGNVLPQFKLEADEIPLENPIFGGAVLSSKYLYCLTEISLEMLEQSAIDIGAAVNSIMSKSMMASLQEYAIYGGGGDKGFAGIINDPLINKVTGDISYATIGEAIRTVQSMNGKANSLLIHPTDWMALQLLTDGAGGQFITPPKFLEDIDVIVTTTMGSGQAIVGNLSGVALGISSAGGVQLDVNAGPGFTRGMVHIRTRFSGDVALSHPNELAVINPAV